MNSIECQICGFAENTAEICSVCGNALEKQSAPFAAEINPPVQQFVSNIPQSNYQNTSQNRPPVRVSKCASCGTEIPALRRFCLTCAPQEKKSGFNFLRLAVILVPLSIGLMFAIWLSYYYFADPVNKTVQDFEKVTGITKDLQFDNYKITGTSIVKVKQTVPNERGNYLSPEHELAFEMVFSKNDRFYVHFYREPKDSVNPSGKKTVYQAGSNGYRHWQSVLAWSNLGVNQAYNHRVKDTDLFPNIVHKNILLGLTDIKSTEKTIGAECAGLTPEAARIVMMPKMYSIDEKKYNAYPCEYTFLSVQDSKGYSSTLGFDPQTGVLLTERGFAVIEDKDAWIEINYGVFKKFSVNNKSGGSTEKRIILIPTSMYITISIDHLQAASIRMNIKTIETNAAVDPTEFEMPIL